MRNKVDDGCYETKTLVEQCPNQERVLLLSCSCCSFRRVVVLVVRFTNTRIDKKKNKAKARKPTYDE